MEPLTKINVTQSIPALTKKVSKGVNLVHIELVEEP